MELSILRRLDRGLRQSGWDRASSYSFLRFQLASRIAGGKNSWLPLFFSDSFRPIPPAVRVLLDSLPVSLEGSSAGITPQSISVLNEFYSSSSKTNGIFYTPWPLARQIARKTLYYTLLRQTDLTAPTVRTLLAEAPTTVCLAAPAARKTDDFLSRLAVCDPAAGTGGLLFPFACELAALRCRLNPKLTFSKALFFTFTHNLYAADISSRALADLQLRAALILSQYAIPPKNDMVLPHTFAGDSLATIDGENILQKQFADVFDTKGGFDVILSNPPYLGQKNHRAIFEILRQNPLWKDRIQPKSDLLYFFFYLALDLLRERGIGSFLTTSYFASAASAKTLRSDLKKSTALLELEDFGEKRLFKRAVGQHNLISIFEKNHSFRKPPCQMGTHALAQIHLYHGDSLFLQTRPAANEHIESVLSKMSRCTRTLQKVAAVTNGLMTGCDKISAAHLQKYPIPGAQKGQGVFVLSQTEANALTLSAAEKAKLKPFFKNSDISSYIVQTRPSGWLIDFFYPNDRELDFARYPHLLAHLARFAPLLLARRQNNNGMDKLLARGIYWFGSVRRKMDFETEKIVVPQRASRNKFAFAPGPWYASSDVYFISKPTDGISLWYLLGLFNSAPYYVWLSCRGKRKGRLLELYSAPLKTLPVPAAPATLRQQLEEIAKQIYQLKSNYRQADVSALQCRADQLVGKLFGFTPAEQQAVQTFLADTTILLPAAAEPF